MGQVLAEVRDQKIDAELLKRECLIAALEKLDGVKFPPGSSPGDDEHLVRKLSNAYSKMTVDKLIQCDDCGGWSDETLEGCPFCGASDAQEGTTAAVPKKAASKKKVAAKKPEKAKPEKPTNGTTALAKHEPALPTVDGVVVGEKETALDDAVERVQKLKGGVGIAAWQLGQEMLAIYSTALWKHRKGEGGKPKYAGWDSFVEAECGIAPRTSYSWMKLAYRFNEEQVRRFGTTNLIFILNAPKEDQGALLDDVASGKLKTTKDVAEAVKKIRKRKGTSRVGGVGKSSRTEAATAAAAKAAAKKASVTALVPEGKKSVKLYTFESFKSEDESKRKRAKKIGDSPVGVLECNNGVTIRLRILTDADGQLVAQVEAMREE